MLDYDYIQKGTKRIQTVRDHQCFSEIFCEAENLSMLSVLLPHYERNLEKLNTEESIGEEKWAAFLGSFIPGTSFVPEYTEAQDTTEEDDHCEFRWEKQPHIHVSAIMKQVWMMGVRYAWEFPYLAEFCLYYYQKNMQPFESFNLFVLSHLAHNNGSYGHTIDIDIVQYTNEKRYAEYMNNTKSGKNGTSELLMNFQYDPKTYKPLHRNNPQLEKMIEDAWRNIESNQKPIPYEKILTFWKTL